jgi:hypothetical protein
VNPAAAVTELLSSVKATYSGRHNTKFSLCGHPVLRLGWRSVAGPTGYISRTKQKRPGWPREISMSRPTALSGDGAGWRALPAEVVGPALPFAQCMRHHVGFVETRSTRNPWG